MMELFEAKEALLESIRQSGAFGRYEESKKRLEQYPERWAQMDAFRQRVFYVQHSDEIYDRIDEMNRLFEERQRIRRDPLIAEFLDAELELCRLLQEISADIMNVADIRVNGGFY